MTGADRGLGLELTKRLLESGYTVFAGRFMKDVDSLELLVKENTETLYLVDLDITNSESVKSAKDYIASKTDRLDILINNAAILGDIHSTIFDELDYKEIQRVIDVNALGPLRVSNALIGLVINSNKKLIVNISSEAGSIGNCYRRSWFGYCMSKTALNMQSAIIHNSINELGGQILLIHPGWMKTYMQGKLDEAADMTAETAAEHIMKIIINCDKYKSDKLAVIDHLGNQISW